MPTFTWPVSVEFVVHVGNVVWNCQREMSVPPFTVVRGEMNSCAKSSPTALATDNGWCSSTQSSNSFICAVLDFAEGDDGSCA